MATNFNSSDDSSDSSSDDDYDFVTKKNYNDPFTRFAQRKPLIITQPKEE